MAGYDNKMVRDHAPGWVYLLHFPLIEVPFYKIGLSRQPFARLNQLRKEPWTFGCVVIAAAFWTNDMADDETFLLERFSQYRTRDGNEYFAMPDSAVADFIHEAKCLARDASYQAKEK